MDVKLLEKLLERLKEHIGKFQMKELKNPFYGKEVYFFEGCVGPILERNQLLGYIGAFSGNNNKLNSKIDYAVLNDSSWKRLNELKSDHNLESLVELLGIRDEKRNEIPNTLIIPESKCYTKVYSFIKIDPVKLKQFKKVDFSGVEIDGL